MRSQGSRGGRRSCDWVFPVSHRFANVVAASTRAWCAGETSMRWTRAFLIVLALFSLGCVRGDWTETLTLVDVTGTWEGRFAFYLPGRGNIERSMRLVLQQKGQQVTGEVQGEDGAPIGSVEGLVKGDLLTWRMTGPLVKFPYGGPLVLSCNADTPVDGDVMRGRTIGTGCPDFDLRRVGTQAIKEKQQM